MNASALLVYDLGWFLLRHNQYVQIEMARIVFVHVYISQNIKAKKKQQQKNISEH